MIEKDLGHRCFGLESAQRKTAAEITVTLVCQGNEGRLP